MPLEAQDAQAGPDSQVAAMNGAAAKVGTAR
jgi:hypothetical protein